MIKKLVIVTVVALMAAPSFAQLAGYWNFNEGSGTTAADSSGKGKNGVLQKNGSGALPLWITGHDGTGKALQFNATATSKSNSNKVFVDIGTADALATIGRTFTVSMWVQSDQTRDWVLRVLTGDWRRLVYTSAYDVELAADPNLASVSGVDFFFSESTAAWQMDLGYETDEQNITGSWYHLALTSDGNYFRKYVNGNLVLVLAAPTATIPAAASDLFIAAMSDGSGYFVGDLDDVAIWTGSYLPATEIAKLVDGTATPLTVVDHAPEAPLPPVDYTLEGDMSWNIPCARAFWSPAFNWDVSLSSNAAKTVWMANAWWFWDAAIMPGSRTGVWEWNKWYPEIDDNTTIYVPNTYPDVNVATHGMEWVDPSWSGVGPTVAKMAAYITPGIVICQENKWFQPYDPCENRAVPWEDKPYWKTYMRVAGVNAAGASLRVRVFTYPTPIITEVWGPLTDPSVLTKIGEVSLPLSGVDHQWQEFKFLLPKAPTIGGSVGGDSGNWWKTHHWFDASIVGGNANTVVYIDEFSPISDRYYTGSFLKGDANHDYVVNKKDLSGVAGSWLDTTVVEPRTGGMLVNGDFSFDRGLLNMADNYSRVGATPTGWTFTGTADKGIQNMAIRGLMNYGDKGALAPLGASVAAYIISDSVLEQTTGATMVAGHTYYAMAYVMTSSWEGWKDTATLTLEANGATLASFARPLSIERWRPVYGKYTALSSDAGKAIKIKLSYANTNTVGVTAPGYMFIGYAYLGDTMPASWPEARGNVLVNGGFDDLSAFEAGYPDMVQAIRNSDNWGAWFVDGVPTPTGWVYEVPGGYSLANKGGIWASGMYGSPLPTPGMTDVSMYTSNTLILGQVVGTLAAGTTYYLDTACGINSARYLLPTTDGNGVNWPSPAPVMHVELWRIPVGVTSGSVIAAAIAGGNPSYVKVAEAYASATGDIAGLVPVADRGTPSSKWQLIGTSYTATSSDTNMYVRIRGTGGADTLPEFAFSDVYLSTAKRVIPGPATTFEVGSGMQYLADGAYDCYQAGQMGLAAITGDVNGDCLVNFVDYAAMCQNWLQLTTFTDATGATDN